MKKILERKMKNTQVERPVNVARHGVRCCKVQCCKIQCCK